MSHYRRTTCCICGSADLREILKMPPVPVSPNTGRSSDADGPPMSIPLDVYFCPVCSHVQLVDILSPELQYTDYRYTTSISLGLAAHFRSLYAYAMDAVAPQPGALVVEIGSNDGTVLSYFREGGMRVLGIDPAKSIAAAATERGIETIADFFTSSLSSAIRAQHGSASIVIANNVLANIDDPNEVVAGVTSLLADDGAFIFETQYGIDVFENNLIDTIYHEHISYFTVASCERLLERNGLSIQKVERIAIKGGSIRVTARKKTDGMIPDPGVAELLRRERDLGYDKVDRYLAFADAASHQRARFAALIDDIVAGDGEVAAFGASVGCVTLLHYLGLTGKVAFIVDDNPLVDVLRGPGYAIPVMPPSVLRERRPAAVVILAWRYAAPIMQKHAFYKDSGGRFLIPLPTIEQS